MGLVSLGSALLPGISEPDYQYYDDTDVKVIIMIVVGFKIIKSYTVLFRPSPVQGPASLLHLSPYPRINIVVSV